MEVRKGFKQTDFGIIPQDWNVVKIQQLLDERIIIGHLDGNHGALYPKSYEFKETGVPYISANDFVDGIVSFKNCKHLSKERACQFQKGIARDGDVLFAHNATVGPVALLKTSHDFVILSTTATYYRCNNEKLPNNYLQFALQAPSFVRQYQSVMAQSTRFQVPITAQRKFWIVVPPLPEQTAIATALSDTDALITSLEKLIEKKRNIKQGAMQELLTGKRRLPGFSGEWPTKTLGHCLLGKPTYGINAPAVPFTENLPVYIRITDISDDGKFIHENKTSVDRIDAENYILEQNDIVFARTGASTGKTYMYSEKDGTLVYAGFLIKVKVNPKLLNAQFLKGYTETKTYWRWVNLMSMRSGQPGINGNEYAQLPIPLPPLEEQIAIATILTDMDVEIESLEKKLNKYRAIKQGMMQVLLTGKIRLADN